MPDNRVHENTWNIPRQLEPILEESIPEIKVWMKPVFTPKPELSSYKN